MRDLSLSAWDFSLERDSRRSLSTFRSEFLSLQRDLIESRALVYLCIPN